MAKSDKEKPAREGGAGKSAQIPLVLPVKPSLERADLLESPANQRAIDLIDSWPDWPSNTVVLAGPVGSGKSHLAKIWAHGADALIMDMASLDESGIFAEQSSLVLEDAVAGSIDETALFHTFNRAKATGNYIVITSRSFPGSWGIELPDLVSRLKLAHVVELHEPDDALLSGIIFKLFADRQLEINPGVATYLVSRMERSMETAARLVEWIDHEALARRRKINRSLASDALEALGQG